SFCGSCASFLEWEGSRVAADEPEPEPEPEVDTEPGHVGIIERVKEKIGMGETHSDEGTPAGSEGSAPAAAASVQQEAGPSTSTASAPTATITAPPPASSP